MNIKQIGIDIGKTTFHLVALNNANDVVIRRKCTRSQLITFFTKRADQGLNVAFEACSGAHWLAHQLIALNQQVRLLTPDLMRYDYGLLASYPRCIRWTRLDLSALVETSLCYGLASVHARWLY